MRALIEQNSKVCGSIDVALAPRRCACYCPLMRANELRIFRSFEEAERADSDYYASLSEQECLEILLDLVAAYRESVGETAERLERVYRVTQLAAN